MASCRGHRGRWRFAGQGKYCTNSRRLCWADSLDQQANVDLPQRAIRASLLRPVHGLRFWMRTIPGCPIEMRRQLEVGREADVGLIHARAGENREPLLSSLDFEQLWERNRICTSTVIVRRSALDQAGTFDVDPLLVGAEDYNLWLRICKLAGRWLVTPRCWRPIHLPKTASPAGSNNVPRQSCTTHASSVVRCRWIRHRYAGKHGDPNRFRSPFVASPGDGGG